MKAIILAAIACCFCACASKRETPPRPSLPARVGHTAAKVPGAAVVFVCGVVTWPCGIYVAIVEDDPFLRAMGLAWPFSLTSLYWSEVSYIPGLKSQRAAYYPDLSDL